MLVRVHNELNSNTYSVWFVEGSHPTCDCKGYRTHYAGTLKTCVHIRGAQAFVAAQVPAAAVEGLETAAEKRARRERAIKDRELWD